MPAQCAHPVVYHKERFHRRCLTINFLTSLPSNTVVHMSSRSSSPSASTVKYYLNEPDKELPPFAVPHPEYYLEDGNLVIQVGGHVLPHAVD